MLRNILVLFVGLVCVFLCTSQAFSFWDGDTIQEEFHNTYEVGPGIKLNVQNINGSVKVSTWDEEYVDVYALKQTRHGQEELDKIQIDVTVDKEMNIVTKRLNKNVRASVNYEIKVPANVAVNRIDNSNGKIELKGTKGDAVLNTSNGKIIAEDVDGKVSAKTSNGGIKISGTAGLLKAKTSNGSIEAEIPSINTEKLEIITSNGSIKLYISGDLNADVEMKTSNGKISLHDIQILTSKTSRTYVKGRIGDGGNNLYVKTSNGKINLYKM